MKQIIISAIISSIISLLIVNHEDIGDWISYQIYELKEKLKSLKKSNK